VTVGVASAFLLVAGFVCVRARAEEAGGDRAVDEEGEVVVVTASRAEQKLRDAVVPTEVITRDEIEASGAQDASGVLETVPGVEIERSFRGAGVRMQGLDSEYVLILVDGKRLIGARDGVIDLSRIPVDRIERIEVVKGAASALYGSDAIAGVINVITRKPRSAWSAEATGVGGLRDTAGGGPLVDTRVGGGLRRERGAAGIHAGWRESPSYDLDPADAQTDGNAVEQASVSLDGEWTPSDDVTVDGAASYTLLDAQGVDESRGATYDRRNLTEESSARAGVSLRRSLTRVHGGLTASDVRDQYLADQRGSDALDVYEESNEKLVQLDGQVDTWMKGGHLFSGGVEGSAAFLVSPRLSADGERFRLGVFVQDEWRPPTRLKLAVVPSARLDVDSWFGTHPTPRLAVRLDPTPTLALRASGGSAFRAPSFKELFLRFENAGVGYVVEGNPALRPETAWNASAGAELSLRAGFRAALDLYYNHLDDMITIGLVQASTPEAPAGEYGYVNVSSARTAGGEARLGWRWREVVDLDLGYAYTDTEDLDLGRPLDGRSPHRATFAVSGRHVAWGLSGTARGEVVGPATFFPDEDGSSTEPPVVTETYVNLKLRAEQAFWKRRVRLFVGVDNALDAGDALYVHLDPRLFYAGLTVSWPGVETPRSDP
jgi:outer membrane receptor for ferrienterochelin and colicins